jgi:hypothetical protein
VFTLTTANPIVLGTTALVFSRYAGIGILPIANGGTGSATADGALTNLGGTTVGKAVFTAANAAAARTATGTVIGTDVQAYDPDLTTWASITPGTGVGTALAVNVGSAGAFTTFNGALGTPSSGTLTNVTGLPIAGLVSSTSTALGVGSLELGNASDTTLARSSAGNMTIEGNLVYRAGGTDVPVADGGTGASTAATGLANLGGVALTDLAASTGAALVGGITTGTGATARTVQAKNRDVVSVADFGALPVGSTTDTTTNINNALTAHAEVFVPAGTYRVDGTVTVPAGKHLRLARGAIFYRYSAQTAATVPLLHLAGNFAQSSGGEFRTQNNHTDGIVKLGHADASSAYNANYWRFADAEIYGVKAANNVAIKLISSQPALGSAYANYFGTIDTVTIVGADVGVQLLEMTNGHEIRNVTMENIGAKFYQLRGAYENKVFGGFCHGGGTTNGAICISLENATGATPEHDSEANQFIGVAMEPGGAATKSYAIASLCSKNKLIIVDNCAGGNSDANGNNWIEPVFAELVWPADRLSNMPGPLTNNVSIRKTKRLLLDDYSANHNVFTTTLPLALSARTVKVTSQWYNSALGRTCSINETWALRSSGGTITSTKISGGTASSGPEDNFNWSLSGLVATGRLGVFNNGTGTINTIGLTVEVFTTAVAVTTDLVML